MKIMEQFITRIRTNLNGVLEMTQMFDGLMMTGDNLANRIIVELNRDGTPVSIDNSYDIVGYIIRSDGYTLDVPGGILTENGYGHAYIDIPDVAYYVSGALSIAIRMIKENTKVVIATATCYVNMTRTNAIIDTSHRIPDVEELLSHIADIDARIESVTEAEEGRVSAESTRVTNEEGRVSAESTRVTNEQGRVSAESSRVTAEQGRVSAESTRQANDTARNYAIDNMAVEATARAYNDTPTATITNVQTAQGTYKKITFGLVPGQPFVIKKAFASIAAMNAYTGSDIKLYDFVVIASTVEDPDNSKLYMKSTTGTGAASWTFLTDLSGAQGIQGPKGDTGNGISNASVDSSYRLNLAFTDGTSYQSGSIRGPQGAKGDTGDQGIQGIQGIQGETGPTGPAGPTGPQGIQGIQGVKGDTGEPGAGLQMSYDSVTGAIVIEVSNAISANGVNF